VIDKNVAHNLSSDPEKVSAILPLGLLPLNEAEVGFVYQGRTLKGVVRAFAAQMAACQATQLVVYERDERFAGTLVPLTPIAEKFANACRGS
jgi:hypothetical protein